MKMDLALNNLDMQLNLNNQTNQTEENNISMRFHDIWNRMGWR